MATYTDYENGRPIVATGGTGAAGFPAVTTMQNVFDASRRNLTAADVAEVLTVPAGTYVHDVFVEVLDGETDQTINVGDGDDPDGYVAAGDVASSGYIHGDGALASGKLYTEEDTIDIEVPTDKAYESLRVRIVAMVTALG